MTLQRFANQATVALAVAVACACLVGCSEGPPPAVAEPGSEPVDSSAKPPSVLLVSLDTLRSDRLGCYGNERGLTPFLDSLAAEGAVFADHSAPSSKTATSHMSMFSGLRPGVHGVRNCYEAETQGASADLPLLPELLDEAGFRTAAFTGGGMLAGELGFARGFAVHDERGGGAPRVFGRAADWLRTYADTEGAKDDPAPFFLFVHTYEVHDPYTAPAAWQERFVDPAYAGAIDATRVELPLDAAEAWKDDPGFYAAVQERFWGGLRPTPEDLGHLRDLYDAGVAFTDHELAGLWAVVQELGLDEDVLLVVTSDHGEAFNEHGKLTHQTLHEEILQVPLLVRWPGRVPAGRRVTEPVQGVDLAPSLLELTGLDPVADHQGRSWAGRLPEPEGPAAVDLVWAELGTPGNESLALRWGRYKLIGERSTKAFELFDLDLDPAERFDAAGNLAELAQQLGTLALDQEAANHALAPRFRTQAVTLGDAARGLLDALGYTGGE